MRRLIFMDGEFCKLTTKGVKFLSIGLVTDTGRPLYVEIDQPDEIIDPWVKDNIVPKLVGNTAITEDKAKIILRDFINTHYGDEKPVLVADVNQFDWNGICELFGVFGIPFFYVPIDLSTILHVNGIDIDINREELCKQLGVNIPNFKKHHALYDAIQCKEIYNKLHGGK